MEPRIYIHRIDKDDRIIYVDENWLDFALENNTPELTAESVYNRPIWDFIEDEETRHIYRLLLEGVRRDFMTAVVPFRCDSPDMVRVMEMQIIPLLDGKVQFNCWLLRQEPREPVRLLDPKAERSGESLTICSWCKRIRLPVDGWVEAEEAVKRADLFGEMPLPNLTHGMCDSCSDIVFSKKDSGRRKAL